MRFDFAIPRGMVQYVLSDREQDTPDHSPPGSEIATNTGVLARDEGVFFMSNDVFELKLTAQAFCRRNKIDIGQPRLTRIIRKVIKRAEHEQKRLERVEITTPDGYSFIDYQDPTGESAVRNIMREVVAG